jgi:WD40 repeat protein
VRLSGTRGQVERSYSAVPARVVGPPLTAAGGHSGIASALYDHTIWVWDITTGQNVAFPFAGHTNLVTPVAFSSDGGIALFGMVAGPFTGHTDSVASVASHLVGCMEKRMNL